MRITLELDADFQAELFRAAGSTKEPADVLLLKAARAGLSAVSYDQPAPRPEGYFADDYRALDEERLALESAMGQIEQRPER